MKKIHAEVKVTASNELKQQVEEELKQKKSSASLKEIINEEENDSNTRDD